MWYTLSAAAIRLIRTFTFVSNLELVDFCLFCSPTAGYRFVFFYAGCEQISSSGPQQSKSKWSRTNLEREHDRNRYPGDYIALLFQAQLKGIKSKEIFPDSCLSEQQWPCLLKQRTLWWEMKGRKYWAWTPRKYGQTARTSIQGPRLAGKAWLARLRSNNTQSERSLSASIGCGNASQGPVTGLSFEFRHSAEGNENTPHFTHILLSSTCRLSNTQYKAREMLQTHLDGCGEVMGDFGLIQKTYRLRRYWPWGCRF